MAKKGINTGGSTQNAFTGKLSNNITDIIGSGSDAAALIKGVEYKSLPNKNSAESTKEAAKDLIKVIAEGSLPDAYKNSDTYKSNVEERKKIGIIDSLKEKNELYSFLDNEDIVLNELANQNSARMENYNAIEAEKARAWQTEMSNTSHQREVADLRAAGLNPVLSANSGATAYTTSSASSTIDSAISALASKDISRMSTAATINAAQISAEMVGKAAEISANASKYASDMAYKSTKYSAKMGLAGMQASASAQRAAANATASASRYAADMNYAGQKYNVDNSRSGTLWGTIGSGVSNDSKVGNAVRKGLKWLTGK